MEHNDLANMVPFPFENGHVYVHDGLRPSPTDLGYSQDERSLTTKETRLWLGSLLDGDVPHELCSPFSSDLGIITLGICVIAEVVLLRSKSFKPCSIAHPNR